MIELYASAIAGGLGHGEQAPLRLRRVDLLRLIAGPGAVAVIVLLLSMTPESPADNGPRPLETAAMTEG